MQKVAKEVMTQAYRHFEDTGGHAALLAAIRPYLKKQDYQQNASSAWLRGRAVPPADVLLAAALVANVSLDELLYGESLLARQDRLEKELAEVRRLVEK